MLYCEIFLGLRFNIAHQRPFCHYCSFTHWPATISYHSQRLLLLLLLQLQLLSSPCSHNPPTIIALPSSPCCSLCRQRLTLHHTKTSLSNCIQQGLSAPRSLIHFLSAVYKLANQYLESSLPNRISRNRSGLRIPLSYTFR
jgi:hypothetical protein